MMMMGGEGGAPVEAEAESEGRDADGRGCNDVGSAADGGGATVGGQTRPF